MVEPGARYTLVRAWRHEDGAYVEGYVPTKKLKMVLPGTRYGVVIDKTAQTLTVYEAGKPVGPRAREHRDSRPRTGRSGKRAPAPFSPPTVW